MKAALFIYYYVLSSLRKKAYELAPESYQKYYLNKTLKKVQQKFPYYSQLEDGRFAPLMNKNLFLKNFSTLNTFGLLYEDCLERGLKQESTRKFHPEAEGFTVGLSSGTSGKRGVFLTTENEQLKWAANLFTHLSWFSFFDKYKIGFILRANSPMYEKVSRSRRINFKFFDLMMPFDQLIKQYLSYQPNVIIAPAYILSELSAYKRAHPESFLEVKIIVSVADVLETQIETSLRNLFKCPVHQIYQATEGFLAATCAHERLHLNEDLLYFKEEVIDEKTHRFSPVITDYFRETQAIVNYRLDDILVLDPTPCPCGSKKRVISKIEGRSDEIVSIGETKIYPDYLRNAVQNAMTESLDFCVIKDHSTLTVKIEGAFDLELEKRLTENFHKLYRDFGLEKTCLTIIEFGFKRDYSMKRRRVFSKDA